MQQPKRRADVPQVALPLHLGQVILAVREAAGPFGQAWDARCKEVAVFPPK